MCATVQQRMETPSAARAAERRTDHASAHPGRVPILATSPGGTSEGKQVSNSTCHLYAG